MNINMDIGGVNIRIKTNAFKLNIKDDDDSKLARELQQDADDLNESSGEVKKALDDVTK